MGYDPSNYHKETMESFCEETECGHWNYVELRCMKEKDEADCRDEYFEACDEGPDRLEEKDD